MNNTFVLVLGVMILGVQPCFGMQSGYSSQLSAKECYVMIDANTQVPAIASLVPYVPSKNNIFQSKYSMSLAKVVGEYFNLLDFNKNQPLNINLGIYQAFINTFTDILQNMVLTIQTKLGPNYNGMYKSVFLFDLKKYILALPPLFLSEAGFSNKSDAIGEFFYKLEVNANMLFSMFLHSREMQTIFGQEYELINKYINIWQENFIKNLVCNRRSANFLVNNFSQDLTILCQPSLKPATPKHKLSFKYTGPQLTSSSYVPNGHEILDLSPSDQPSETQAGSDGKKRGLDMIGQGVETSAAKRQKVRENGNINDDQKVEG